MKKNKTSGKKDIGLGIEPPKESCSDVKCPWHGKLPVRGKIMRGEVRSSKTHGTVIVESHYHRFVQKYQRYERRKSKITAYNPPCMRAKDGDKVILAECRPLSKTKHFVVVSVEKSQS